MINVNVNSDLKPCQKGEGNDGKWSALKLLETKMEL